MRFFFGFKKNSGVCVWILSAYRRWLINANPKIENHILNRSKRALCPQPATEVTRVYVQGICTTFHSTLCGSWSPLSSLSPGTMRGKITGVPRYTETAVLWCFTQFYGVLSGFFLLPLMRPYYSSLCHHLSKPQCSYQRQSADGAAGLHAAVGQQN